MADRVSRILVVDDDQYVLASHRIMLSEYGFESYVSASGVDALNFISLLDDSALPDCIVTDYEMPLMNGLEFVKHIRENARFRHIPIIMLSGAMKEEFAKEVLALGVTHAMHKILTPRLPSEIKRILKI